MSRHSDNIDWHQIISIKNLAFTITGVIFAVIALKGFMVPNHFLDGGVTGISILLHEVFHIDLSLFLVVLNLPFLYLGYKKIGKTFAVQSAFAIILLTILMHVLTIPKITDDKILIAVFGGFLIGLGIGLVIRGGGVIDGFEIIADYTNKRSAFTSSEIILFINSVLFLSIAYYFGLESAMYSILTYFTAIKTTDYVVDGFEEFTALTVISKDFEEVKSIIVNDYNKGITVYKGERGYLPESFQIKHDCDIITVIVTRLEVYQLKKAIQNIDPNAFFYIESIKEVSGGIISRKTNH